MKRTTMKRESNRKWKTRCQCQGRCRNLEGQTGTGRSGRGRTWVGVVKLSVGVCSVVECTWERVV